MATRKVIEVSELKKSYGEVRALDGMSLYVEAGEVFGMLGPNGAGKTTAIECIEGLRDPDSGAIEVMGMSHGSHRQGIKARIGVQLQTTGLYPKLTVAELLSLFSAFYPSPQPVESLIKMVGLQDKARTRSQDLSGGQRQRLSLALALVGDPEVVFLDEPTTGLDPQARRAVWDVVRDLQKLGKSVMLTTHYMEEAEELCDRVGVVDHGRVIEMDTPRSLIARYFDQTAIEFTIPAGQLPGRLEGLPGVTNCLAEAERVVLYTSDVPRTMAGLFDSSSGWGTALSEMTVRSATLEDVFLKLTGRSIRG